MHQNERQIIEELREIMERTRPMIAKSKRGEMLSTAESRQLAVDTGRITELRIDQADAQAARILSQRSAAEMGGTPSFGSDDDTESRSFTNYLRSGVVAPEMRAASEGTASAGGYLVPPGWWQRLQIALRAYGGTAMDFTQLETDTGQSMQWATNDPTTTVGTLIGENTQIDDVDYVFGQGTMSAYMYTSGVQKVSFQLAQDSAFDIDQFVQARVAESLGRKESADAISGTGSSQPLGVVTALAAATGMSSGGVYTLGTAKKVNVFGPGSGTAGIQQVTELTGNALAPDTLNAVISSVDVAYRSQGAKFYMNDVTLAGHRNVVDGYGQPLYKGLQSPEVTGLTLQGYQVVIDNNIPDLTASTASGLIFGYLPSAMTLRRVKGAGLMRLEERYADFLQIGFIGYERIDIRSNDLRAAVVVKPSTT